MAAGGQADQAAAEFAEGYADVLGRVGHAGIGTDIGIGIDVQNVENPVAQPDVQAGVIGHPDTGAPDGLGIGRPRTDLRRVLPCF